MSRVICIVGTITLYFVFRVWLQGKGFGEFGNEGFVGTTVEGYISFPFLCFGFMADRSFLISMLYGTMVVSDGVVLYNCNKKGGKKEKITNPFPLCYGIQHSLMPCLFACLMQLYFF